MRKTKIVCTLGPATSSYEAVKKLAQAGMNVARINMSHGSHDDHIANINNVKRVREELNIPLSVLLDTKGPEIRIKTFENGHIILNSGDNFTLTSRDIVGNQQMVSVNYAGLVKDIQPGNTIFLNNALIELRVDSVTETDINCTVLNGGELSNRKSLNAPGVAINLPYISEADKKDVLMGINNDVDFIAASFVCCAQNLIDLREFMLKNGGENIDIIAKIESLQGVNNFSEISRVSDGIMVARGDLGVEIPFEEIPFIQKKLIKDARLQGKRVITATEMLESMLEKARPTRAETSDVGNAVYDETSAVMLSGETAVGKFPVEAVTIMSRICRSTEKHIDYNKRFKKMDVEIRNIADAVSHSTCNTSIDLNAKAIVVFTRSGMTGRMVSRFRPIAPIIGVTDDAKVYRKLALSWGVYPVLSGIVSSTDELYKNAVDICKNLGIAKGGDIIVIAAGVPLGQSGLTNMIKVEEIPFN